MMMARTKDSSATRPCRTLILGLGKTGLAFTRWLQANGESARVADTRDLPPGRDALAAGFDLHTGPFQPGLLDDMERVFVSPGIEANNELLAEARARELPVFSDIDLFVEQNRQPVIAVTGSNGKSTVVSLCAALLEAAGLSVKAGGNLGTPVLDMLGGKTPDVYVLELSSFQLDRTARLGATVATVLNLSADHLDWHGSMSAYRAAKQRIFIGAGNLVVNRDEAGLAAGEGADKTVTFGLSRPSEGHFGRDRINGEEHLMFGARTLLNVKDLYSSADYEQLNALAALALVSAMGVDVCALTSALGQFQPLEHRATRVARHKDVLYINDSKATNTGSAIASIQATTGPLTLIAGGDAKGADLSPLRAAVGDRLQAAIVFGQSADELDTLFAPLAKVYRAGAMSEAVAIAAKVSLPQGCVLLAPACAAAPMFLDYKDRGSQFEEAVRGLFA